MTHRKTLMGLALFLAALFALPAGAVRAQETPAQQRVTLFDHPVTGGASICTTALTVASSNYPSTAMRLTVAIKPGSTDSVCKVVVKRGSVEFALPLNSNTALTAGNLYTFSWGVAEQTRNGGTDTAITWNVQFGTTTTLAYLDLQEVQIP